MFGNFLYLLDSVWILRIFTSSNFLQIGLKTPVKSIINFLQSLSTNFNRRMFLKSKRIELGIEISR